MRGFRAGRVISFLLAIAILVLAVWFFSQDHQPPEIKSLRFKSRVAWGEAQEVFIVVVEKEPADSVFLRFNSSTVQVPLAQKYGNGTVVYSAGFDPSSILAGEGLFTAELIVRDEAGNEARRILEFLANLEAPLIKNASVEGGLGGLEFWVEIEEDNLKEAFVEYDGRKAVLTRVGAKFFARVEPGCALNYMVRAVDVFGLSSSQPVEAPLTEVSLYCSSLLFREIYSKDKALASSILAVAKSNGSALPKNLAYRVLDQIERDNRVGDKIGVARNAFKILNDLEVNNLIHKNSICILGNYSQALAQGLPEHSAVDIKRLIGASESCDDIVDFEPVIIRDVTGNEIRIESKNLARDYWIVCEFLKNRPEIASQPKKFEWINRMMQQIAWKFFDDEYGPSFYDKKTYKPNEPEVWNVILGFHDYMDSLPAKLEKVGIGVIFPYHDSNLLKSYIADKTNRTIALFYLADLPARTIDKEFARKYVEEYRAKGGKGYPSDLVEKSLRNGIEGMKKFVEQLPMEYEEIRKLYPNGKVGIWQEDPRNFYYGWLGDRQGHGLNNTVHQFVGIKLGEADNEADYIKLAKERNAIDQFLTKNWKPWDLIKFIYGYERFKSAEWGGEWEMYRYGLPLAFKALGIPAGVAEHGANFGINSDPFLINQGAPGSEWAVTLPDNVIQQLRQTFLNNKIITDYANRISLFSSIDGLLRDSSSVQWIGTTIRDKTVYLWEKK
ncbi:MAG: hypothetical protein QXI87_05330 [Thermoproteota archaeon]